MRAWSPGLKRTELAELPTMIRLGRGETAKLKLGEADEWMNLLSIDADPRVGFCFWDAGTLTFTVHKKDLAIADFSNVCISLESS